MLASVILDEVGEILNDMEAGHEHVRWPVSELLQYLTEATAAIAQGKPSAFVLVDRISLAPGSTQRLPDQFCKLINVNFNINRDGSAGANVLPGVYELQQAFQKLFRCSYDGVIQSYAPFPGTDRYFMVTPAVPEGLTYTPQIEAVVMLTLQAITSASQPVYMPGSDPQLYQGALVDWTLYRAYSKDQEATTSLERSQAHLKAFQAYLGVAAMMGQQSKKQSAQAPRMAA